MVVTTDTRIKMTPEERRRFLLAPIRITTIGGQKSWSGTAVSDHGTKDRYYAAGVDFMPRSAGSSEPDHTYWNE